MESPRFTGDEVAAAEPIREVDELGATGRDLFGEVMWKLRKATRFTKEERGASELARSPRSTQLQSGGASVDLEHRSLLGLNGVARGAI